MRGLSLFSRQQGTVIASFCLCSNLLRAPPTLAFVNRHADVLPVRCGWKRFLSNESTNVPTTIHDSEKE
jgi:hypothetical protein